MAKVVDLDVRRCKQSLISWIEDCKRRMGQKFPLIDFESNHWPFRTLYKIERPDWHFTATFASLHGKDCSFFDVVRGLVAEIVIKNKPKLIAPPIRAFCLLSQSGVQSIFELTLGDLRQIEDSCLAQANANHASAESLSASLVQLKKLLSFLAGVGVIPRLGFHLRREVKAQLRKISSNHKNERMTQKRSVLDHKIEAFNDALKALYEKDPRLSAADCMAIALGTRSMCAPSRINEILCSAVDDHVTVEDYAQKPSLEEFDVVHRAHQMLLLTMKGSKGASWGAKPALNFMIDAFNYTNAVIKTLSQRSRTLIEWYQQNPYSVYLPPELEYLRGENLSHKDVAKIVFLTENPSKSQMGNVSAHYCKPLKESQIKLKRQAKGPRSHLPFKVVEDFLLQKVHLAIEACRRVTRFNHYQGDLSKMLCLIDSKETPFLPKALTYATIRKRLTQHGENNEPSLFEKLKITMPVNGKIQVAWLETHDPRRWLTTQALLHGEKLSDVLINKWANRLKLAQLKRYDLRSNEELAASSKMPAVLELVDISNGIERINKLGEEFGLQSQIVTVPDADICVTSMDLVVQAIEDRPVARTSEQIIVLYPSQFGVCLHQHHETPCRNYDSCLPCHSNVVVKGHQPSNDKIRHRANLLYLSIIRQMDTLVVEYNRGIADDPEAFAQHIVTLVEKGLDPEEMADYLIDEFHQIKDMVQDKLLAKRLEEAFVARGFVQLLDDVGIPNGAAAKYHNPTYHAAPGLEKALASHGGREQILQNEQALTQKYPQFAPKALHLKDERHLLAANGEDYEDK